MPKGSASLRAISGSRLGVISMASYGHDMSVSIVVAKNIPHGSCGTCYGLGFLCGFGVCVCIFFPLGTDMSVEVVVVRNMHHGSCELRPVFRMVGQYV